MKIYSAVLLFQRIIFLYYHLLFEKNQEKLIEIEKIIEIAFLKNETEMVNRYTDLKKLLETQNQLLGVTKQSKKIDIDILKKE